MRKCEKTHPWLTFKVSLKPAPASFWIMLGECKSKIEHIKTTPLEPDIAQELYAVFLAKGAHGTTAIEGNTLTEEDVRKYLDHELELPPSKEYLGIEVDNMVNLFNKIVSGFNHDEKPVVNLQGIKEINKSILKELKLSEEVVPGKIRIHNVGVMRYPGAPPEDCEYLVEKLCGWINGKDFLSKDGMEKVGGLIKAILAHLYLAWIHPFGDGNGRTARMVEFQILVESGFPVPAAHLLSSHYNATRTEYYRQLDMASKSRGDIIPFLEYSVQGFLDGLNGQLAYLGEQVLDLTWTNYIYQTFRKKKKTARNSRIRDLLRDISKADDFIKSGDIYAIMSQNSRYAYSKVQPRTLLRDIEQLHEMELIHLTEEGIKARRENILPYLPYSVTTDALNNNQ